MSFALVKGTIKAICNSVFSNGTITTSTIDMNGGVITSGGAPVNPGDLVTKAYVDGLSSGGIPSTYITLTSTTYTMALSAVLKGQIQIFIIPIVSDNAPGATFILSKNNQTRECCLTRLTSSCGVTTQERLQARWRPNFGIEIRKDGNGYDGQYQIKYILTP
jgi:hypothetical protein